jgi:DNA-binding response OmpR family regulator
MDDYMTKPISPDMLNTKISQWLGDAPKLEENQKAAG